MSRLRFFSVPADAAGAPPAAPAPAPAGDGATAPTPQAPAAPPTPAAPATPTAGDALPEDPAALKGMIADLRKENASARTNAKQTQAREAAVQLAVYKAATTHQGDPVALLDSLAFLAKVADLDPAAADFQTQVNDAIKAAVADNPKLKAVQVAGSSSVDHAGGSGEGGKSKSLAQAVDAALGVK